jgi:hypothetical protein
MCAPLRPAVGIPQTTQTCSYASTIRHLTSAIARAVLPPDSTSTPVVVDKLDVPRLVEALRRAGAWRRGPTVSAVN